MTDLVLRLTPRLHRGLLAVVSLLLAALAPAGPAAAQGRLEARYEASLAGIPIGKGAWAIEIGDDQYSAAANGGTSGLMKTFAGLTGNGSSQGRIVNRLLAPATHSAS